MSHAIDLMITAIQFIVVLVIEFIGIVDLFLATWMTRAGVGPQLQLFILLTVAILIVIGAVRTAGPVFSMLVIILLVLLLLHRVIPDMGNRSFTFPGPLQGLPGAMQPLETIHT